jgi:hypothetical protein
MVEPKGKIQRMTPKQFYNLDEMEQAETIPFKLNQPVICSHAGISFSARCAQRIELMNVLH